jgi:hypothetical protein
VSSLASISCRPSPPVLAVSSRCRSSEPRFCLSHPHE